MLQKHAQFLSDQKIENPSPLFMILQISENISGKEHALSEQVDASSDPEAKKQLKKKLASMKALTRNLNLFVQDAFL